MSDDNISSELGTREYWKEFYEKELENFQDHGDVGEIWFGENSMKRIMKWLSSSSIPKTAPILDVGCGNGIAQLVCQWLCREWEVALGSTVFPGFFIDVNVNTGVVPFRSQPWAQFVLVPNQLSAVWFVYAQASSNPQFKPAQYQAKNGFQNLTGIDYVEEAVQLASSVAKEEDAVIQYEAVDFLQDFSSLPASSVLHRKYKVVIDKGTYDAVGLCPNDGQGKRLKYVYQMNNILDVDGILILTSCNWTKEELLQVFEGFQAVDEILASAFNFGGKTGRAVTTLVMKRKV